MSGGTLLNMTEEASNNSVNDIVRLHALVRLASSPAQSNRASRVINEAVAALDIQACVFHRLREDGSPEMIASHSQPGIEMEALAPLALLLLKEVASGRCPLLKNDLSHELGDEPLVRAGVINNYLGVPLFDSRGEVLAVGSLFSGDSRPFNENDQWWLETAARLAAAAFACESLQERLRILERATEQAQNLPPPVSNSPEEGGGRETQSDKLSVLVVDDDHSVNNLVRRFLIRQGHQVDSASDGMEALRMFHPALYDVVISDIVMPGINGWELVASLHGVAPKLPVIIITGYSSSNNSVWNKHFLQSQGITAVLNKPLDFEYLSSILEGILNKKRQSLGAIHAA